MDTKVLQVLVAVVEAGSMSAAARRLGTTRSNVSRRLKQLEQALRVQLFRRTTRRVEPTQLGWALYQHAAKIDEELAALQATVEDLGRSVRGHVRVSVPIGLGQLVLGPLLLEFAEQYPEVTLQLTFSNRPVVDPVGEGMDVAVRVASAPPETSVARELGRVEWVLCLAPPYRERHGEPATPAALAEHAVVSAPLPGSRLVLTLADGRRSQQLELMPRLQCPDLLFLKRAVLDGLGIGVLPHYIAAAELAAGSLSRVLPRYRLDSAAWGERLYLITAPDRYPTAAARALTEFLRLQFAERGAALQLLDSKGH